MVNIQSGYRLRRGNSFPIGSGDVPRLSIDVFEFRRDPIESVLASGLPGGRTQSITEVGIGGESFDGLVKFGPALTQQAIDPVGVKLLEDRDISKHHRFAARHRLEDRDALVLDVRRDNADVAGSVGPPDVVDPAGESEAVRWISHKSTDRRRGKRPGVVWAEPDELVVGSAGEAPKGRQTLPFEHVAHGEDDRTLEIVAVPIFVAK